MAIRAYQGMPHYLVTYGIAEATSSVYDIGIGHKGAWDVGGCELRLCAIAIFELHSDPSGRVLKEYREKILKLPVSSGRFQRRPVIRLLNG